MLRPVWDELILLFSNNTSGQERFIKKYESELSDLLMDLSESDESFHGNFDLIIAWVFGIVVDWREYEEDIVNCFNAMLQDDDSLSVRFDENDDYGIITYNSNDYKIPLTMSPSDRYEIIRALCSILKDKYGVKLFTSTYPTDTHIFLLLPLSWWNQIDCLFPNTTKQYFTDISVNIDFQ